MTCSVAKTVAVGSLDKAMRASQPDSRPIISHIEMTLLRIILTRKPREDGVAQSYKSSQHTLSILNGKGISVPDGTALCTVASVLHLSTTAGNSTSIYH